MKKLMILLLALGLTGVVSAQIPAFSIGPKIGYNTTKLTTDISSIRSELKSNIQFGLFMRLGEKVYFQPEINYVTKGGVLNGVNSADEAISQEVTLKTITIPLLAGVKLVDLKAASVHLVGGPVASFAFDRKISITDPGDTWPINSTNDFKTATWAIQAGAGIDVLIFTFDIRYEIGLNNIYDGSSDFSLKNHLLNISLGLKLF